MQNNSASQKTLREDTISEIGDDRRKKRRYPISMQVEFKIVKNYLVIGSGSGTCVDLSSNGIAFTTDKPLRVGSYMELSANWPVLLNGACPLKLVIFGKVVRSNGNFAAIAADRHEFRTRKAGSMPPSNSVSLMAAGVR